MNSATQSSIQTRLQQLINELLSICNNEDEALEIIHSLLASSKNTKK